MESVTVEIDLRLSTPNALSNEHFYTRGNRRRKEKQMVLDTLDATLERIQLNPDDYITVLIKRIGPVPLDDDNLVYSCKTVRDAIADWLNRNDNDPHIRWAYSEGVQRVEAIIPAHGKQPAKMGLRIWVEVSFFLSKEILRKPEIFTARMDPIEDLPCKDDIPPWEHPEPVIKWDTPASKVKVLNRIPRLGGTKMRTPTELVLIHKRHPAVGDYVQSYVEWNIRHGPWRSRGVAFRLEEIPHIVPTLQAFYEANKSRLQPVTLPPIASAPTQTEPLPTPIAPVGGQGGVAEQAHPAQQPLGPDPSRINSSDAS
jgi:hypothetical protein